MKYLGRRQSTNIIDLSKQIKSINIYWLKDEQTEASVTLDTDGSLYLMKGSNLTTSINIGVIPYNYKILSLTTGQKNMLQQFVGTMNKSEVIINPPLTDDDIILVQFIQAILNN